LQLNYPGLHGIISKPNALVDIDRQNGVIKIETKTDDAPTIHEMTLFIFGD
jgi:hypothetical protein